MNKKKIIFINILIFFILFVLSEGLSFLYIKTKYSNDSFKYCRIKNPTNEKYDWLRPVEYRDNSKAPILLFGCSFAYGFELEEDETFSRKLADYTNRTVVNRALPGEGPAFMYKQMTDPSVIAEIKKELKNQDPIVIIYNILQDHSIRTFEYRLGGCTNYFNEMYTIKNNKLKRNQPLDIFTPFHSLYTVILFEKIKQNIVLNDYNKVNNTNIKLLAESYKVAKENFPTSKFVITLKI